MSTCIPMFIAELATIGKLWKDLKCQATDEWIKKMWYKMSYYLVMKKMKLFLILPFATRWMELECIMLSEISQSEKNKYHMILLICGIKKQNR